MEYPWSIHQLTEYFDAVISAVDEYAAARVAVERAGEVLGAEFVALILDDDVFISTGLGRDRPTLSALMPAVAGAGQIELHPLGLIHAATARLDRAVVGHLVIGRIDEAFDGEERQLLQGMGSILGLALRSQQTLQAERDLRTERECEALARLHLLETLEQRQQLLESLLTIQKAISHRAPSQAVFDAVTSGAARLLDNAHVALVLRDRFDGSPHVASVGSTCLQIAADDSLVVAAAIESIGVDGIVVHAGCGPDGETITATPVHTEGIMTGSLVAVIGAGWANGDGSDLLAAFAEQASLALTDAQTVEAMRDAYHDSLTGLPNRALFLDILASAVERATRQHTEVTVLFIDLDRFKDVNDTLGHAAGDALLAGVAGRISSCLRSEDTAARLGGDEFAVLLEGTSGNDLGAHVAARIISSLRTPIQLGEHEVLAFASVGIASSDQSAHSPDDLLRNADIAMYTAKRSGSRAGVFYVPPCTLIRRSVSNFAAS